MNTNDLPSERVSVLAVINPVAASTGTATSGYAWVGGHAQIMALLKVGAMSTSGSTGATIAFSLLQATTSSAADAKAFGTAATTLYNISTSHSDINQQVIINQRTDAMDVAGGFQWVAMQAVTSNSPATYDAVLLGFDPRMGPGSDQNITSVSQVLSS